MAVQRPSRPYPSFPFLFSVRSDFDGFSFLEQDEWKDEQDFFNRLYPSYRAALFSAASKFASSTQARPKSTLVVVSAGFDASVHEYPSMQRHGRNVPTAFYTRFAADAAELADELSAGTLVAVLEGGYADSALSSGIAAFLTGLIPRPTPPPQQPFFGMSGKTPDWGPRDVSYLEKALSPGATTTTPAPPPRWAPTSAHGWLSRAQRVFSRIHPTDRESRPKRERRQQPARGGNNTSSRAVSGTHRGGPTSSSTSSSASVASSPSTTRMTTRSGGVRSAGSTPTGTPAGSTRKKGAKLAAAAVPPHPPPPPQQQPSPLVESTSGVMTPRPEEQQPTTTAMPMMSAASTASTSTSDVKPLPRIRFVWKEGEATATMVPQTGRQRHQTEERQDEVERSLQSRVDRLEIRDDGGGGGGEST
jgi:histone deacetylase HOS3